MCRTSPAATFQSISPTWPSVPDYQRRASGGRAGAAAQGARRGAPTPPASTRTTPMRGTARDFYLRCGLRQTGLVTIPRRSAGVLRATDSCPCPPGESGLCPHRSLQEASHAGFSQSPPPSPPQVPPCTSPIHAPRALTILTQHAVVWSSCGRLAGMAGYRPSCRCWPSTCPPRRC